MCVDLAIRFLRGLLFASGGTAETSDVKAEVPAPSEKDPSVINSTKPCVLEL